MTNVFLYYVVTVPVLAINSKELLDKRKEFSAHDVQMHFARVGPSRTPSIVPTGCV